MLGAICGDIIGSIYEGNNVKAKDFKLFDKGSRFTDDTVMTIAISQACCEYLKNRDEKNFRTNCIKYMRDFGREYINAGYGGKFIYWILSNRPEPYNSYGNGSAMRVSAVPWVSKNLKEAEKLARISAEVTHNHPDGIAGAQAVASAIWILLNGGSKNDVKNYIQDNYYKLDFKLDDIREDYKFDVSCKGSVPQAIEAFLEAEGYEDTIRNAISIGGDSDTIGAIAGSLAEACYGVPKEIRDRGISYLDSNLKIYVNEFYSALLNKQEKKIKSDTEEER